MVNGSSSAACGKPRLHNFQGQVITILKRPGRDEPPDCLDHLWVSLSKERTIVAGANIDPQLFKKPIQNKAAGFVLFSPDRHGWPVFPWILPVKGKIRMSFELGIC
ncbi:hypothetical protein [Phaeobacter gallaeciensis]|uniref:hypothetical protein n=1 Tax=Phaeobacter gallaeciensis TaxID=60890 RepID=UPI0011AB8022|nr:hypothetical protein [Phaeobacter gallaeciensis]